MRPGSPFPFKMALLFLVATVAFTSANAQLKRKQIIDEKKALSRKSEKNVVVVNTRTMNELMTKCIELGIEDAKLVFTRIRAVDMADYVSNHPEAAGYEKDILGRMTVLIKVEGDNIAETDFVTDADANPTNSIIQKMNSAGLVRVKKPYGNIPYTSKVLYFEVGSICPPPNSCN